jgi:hypothetical protein
LTAKFRNEDESKQFQSRSRINIPLISTPLNTALKFSLTEMFETEKKQLPGNGCNVNHSGNLLKLEACQAVENDAKSVTEFKIEFEKCQKAKNTRQENINPTPTNNNLSSLPITLPKVTVGSWNFCDSCLTLNKPDAKKCANCDQNENLTNNENGKGIVILYIFCV